MAIDLKRLKDLAGKATKGPWKPVEDAQGTCGLMHPRKKGVAVAWFSSTFQPTNDYVGEAEHKLGRPEREANAQLIAALHPAAVLELIEELERLRDSQSVDA